MPTLPNESSRETEQARTLGMEQFDAQGMGFPGAYQEGSLLYPAADVARADRFAQGPMYAYYAPGNEAPWKVAEEWQIANISYAVEYANQDYRNMNAAQANASTWRTKLPKVFSRPSTPEIVNNLADAHGSSLVGDDAAILSLLGL